MVAAKTLCRFVCENDPDELKLRTLSGQPFLAVNGVQTLSHDFLNLIDRVEELREMGVSRFRLSPHSCNMVRVATAFRGLVDGLITATEAADALIGLNLPGPFSSGFYDGKPALSPACNELH